MCVFFSFWLEAEKSMKPHNNFNNIIVPKSESQCNEHHCRCRCLRQRHHISNLVAISIYNVLKPNLSYIKWYFICGEGTIQDAYDYDIHVPSSQFSPTQQVSIVIHSCDAFWSFVVRHISKCFWSEFGFKILVTGIPCSPSMPLWQRSVGRLRMKNERHIHGKMAKLSRMNFSS